MTEDTVSIFSAAERKVLSTVFRKTNDNQLKWHFSLYPSDLRYAGQKDAAD